MIAFLAPEQSIAISGCNHGGSLNVDRPRSGLSLTNTWQIDCHFVRFDAARCAFDELPTFIGKSRF